MKLKYVGAAVALVSLSACASSIDVPREERSVIVLENAGDGYQRLRAVFLENTSPGKPVNWKALKPELVNMKDVPTAIQLVALIEDGSLDEGAEIYRVESAECSYEFPHGNICETPPPAVRRAKRAKADDPNRVETDPFGFIRMPFRD